MVRGPASVVWGANAFTGVVNIITKSPRDNEGVGFNLSAGVFSRDAETNRETAATWNVAWSPAISPDAG